MGLKERIIRGAILASRKCIRFTRVPGSRYIYDKLVDPYLGWRPIDVRVKTRFGATMIVRPNDTIGHRICFFGIWEPVITRYFMSGLSSGDTFIDVGANIGYYSLLAAKKVGPSGRIHAIEASPTIFASLERNIGLNPFKNIHCANVAITEKPTEVTVYLEDETNLGHTTIMMSEYDKNRHRIEATVEGLPLQEVVPLDEILSARFIKIDVEGAEWPVIQGMKHILPRLSKKTEILLEVNAQAVRQAGGSVEELIELFRHSGLVAFPILNSYSDDMYFNEAESELTPLEDLNFSQIDLVIRRPA